ncbi:hypothetical protein KJ966_00495 [bacterium]|nr:hypothetical protein [bacterium]
MEKRGLTLLPTLIAALLLAVLTIGCSPGTLLTRDDYQVSLHHHYGGLPQKALEKFPAKEKGYFITVLEKAYLNLLSGKPEITPLKKLADTIEKRIRYQGSREVQSLFYAETPEGYYASEHEIIWLHILLSWGYSERGEYEEACVEARKASHLLTAPWSHEGHFDDPLLRIILGGMWTRCGSWDDAVVDFRRAYQLAPEKQWLKELADLEEPPKNLFLILGGVGPTPTWDPSAETNLVRGFRHVTFTPQGKKSDLSLTTKQDKKINLHLSPDSSQWYQRHFERDNAIHELIVDSHYTTRAAGSITMESAKMATAYTVGTVVVVGSIAVGAAVIYYSVLYLSGDIAGYAIGLGLGIGIKGTDSGIGIITRTTDDSLESIGDDLDSSKAYRFVRYLPEYVWVGWNDEELSASDLSLINNGQQIALNKKENSQNVFWGFSPDINTMIADRAILYPLENRWEKWSTDLIEYLNNSKSAVSWDSLRHSASNIKHVAKTEDYAFSMDYQDQDLKIRIDGNSIECEVLSGLFKESSSIIIDLKSKKIKADEGAKKVLVETLPHSFITQVLHGINQETRGLLKRK